jgi:hypothetical protein
LRTILDKVQPPSVLLEALFFPEKLPDATPVARLSLEESTRRVILDGRRCYPITSPSAFRLFAALHKADREGQTPISIKNLLVAARFPRDKDTRPDRLFRHLPIRVRSIIKSRDGHGGGYSLLLPPLP